MHAPLARARSSASPEEFQQRWQENYGSAVAALPAVQRYVKSTPRLAGYRDGREPEWDGIDMCWFSSLEQARQDRALASLNGLIERDAPNRLYTRESVVIKPRV